MGLLKVRRRPEPVARVSERDCRLVWRIAALLLDYPSEQMLATVDQIDDAALQLPDVVGAHLLEFVHHLRATPPITLAQQYVETFDMRRRSSMHLTFYAYGDTRKRGMALLRFKHAYRHAGVELGDEELPDHLPVLLEFAATVDPIGGERLLGEHVPVIELLRLSLADNGSPYAGILAAVVATLPPLTTADRRRIAELAAQGPPEEAVGLGRSAGSAPAGLDPFTMDPALLAGSEARR